MTQKSILVARAIFPEVLEMLSKHFQVESNQADDVWPPDVLKQKMQGKVGALTSASQSAASNCGQHGGGIQQL